VSFKSTLKTVLTLGASQTVPYDGLGDMTDNDWFLFLRLCSEKLIEVCDEVTHCPQGS